MDIILAVVQKAKGSAESMNMIIIVAIVIIVILIGATIFSNKK